ncbi:MAG: efflux RND transporter periplasmic adaptor subunit [Pirellula sp.]
MKDRRFSLSKLLRVVLALGFACESLANMSSCAQDTLPSANSTVNSSADATGAVTIESAILKTVEVTSVAAQVQGLLSSVSVREGDRLKIQSPLAAIQSTTTDLQLQRARVALEAAQKNFESNIDVELSRKGFAVAENEYLRAIEANKRVEDVYPPMEVDRLKLVRDRANLEIERSLHAKEISRLELTKMEIEHRQLQDMLDKHTILAPVSGMVVAVEKRAGEWVEPGTVVLRVVEIDRLRIEGFIKAEQADPNLIDTNAKVELQISGKTIETTAKLVFISPEVNPINSQVRVFLDLDNRDGRFRPGLRPKVWIPTAR